MKHSVLIVDDTVENIDILKEVLSEEYIIRAATNGMVALKIAEKFKPNIILLDIMMPGMDGYEVCQKLKSNPITSEIPVIFVTAMSEDSDEAKGFDVGAVDYITKPISSIVVKARVRNQLALADQKIALDYLVKQKTKELSDSRIDLVNRLGLASEYKDFDTGKHLVRVSKYVNLIATECGLPGTEIDIITLAAPMHDIGKIGIDDNILKKPGKFTDEEFEIMKNHCLIGERLLSTNNDKLLKAASILAGQHHEKYDGTGYPRGLKGNQIHLYAKITTVADVFDALTSERTYKRTWTIDEAFNYVLEKSGTQFDPFVVEHFSKLKPKVEEVYNTHSE